MTTQELRIGNWVNNYFDRPLQILRIISEENTGGYKLKTLQPIPLTPEILEKCGFGKHPEPSTFWRNTDNEYWGTGSNHESFVLAFNNGEFRKYFACEDDEYSWTGKTIKYLHQLQNLFFALVGEELNYTP